MKSIFKSIPKSNLLRFSAVITCGYHDFIDLLYRRVHISKDTYHQLKSGKFEVEPGEGGTRDR